MMRMMILSCFFVLFASKASGAGFVFDADPEKVARGELVDSILERNYNYAAELALDLIDYNRERIFYMLTARAADYFAGIINDSGKGDREKKEMLYAYTESLMSSYDSGAYGELDLVLHHAPGTGVTKLSWSDFVKVDRCDTYIVDMHDGITYARAYVYKYPDYNIYRIVDGEEKRIGQIEGRRLVSEYSFSTGNPLKGLMDIYNYYNDRDDRKTWDVGQIGFYDYFDGVYGGGRVISYKVVADNSGQRLGSCGSSQYKISEAPHDVSADGYPDYIPRGEFLSFIVPLLKVNLL